jgi:NADH-quinone oxidoreductase subunit N
MAGRDFVAVLPFLVLMISLVAMMLLIAFYRNHKATLALSLVGLSLAFVTLPIAASNGPLQVTQLLILDNFTLFYFGLMIVASIAIVLLSYPYLERQAGDHEEFYVLLLLAVIGAGTLIASSHFVSFFLGLEILSISLYALTGYLRRKPNNIEAGIKYLVLAAVASAFLLFGMALVYADLGTMSFAGIANFQSITGLANTRLLFTGFGLLVVGIGFKLAVVPFHMWTPDVYEGAPAPVTAFVATVSKGSIFVILLRFFKPIYNPSTSSFFLMFALIAAFSMIMGNLLALQQKNVKRILAYSSIAHLGYLMVAFLASGAQSTIAATFYLVAYFLTTLGAFGVITLLSSGERDADRLEDYTGLFWRRPWTAGIFTIALLSLAGIPLTAGFIGKFYLVLTGIGSALWWLVIVLVVTSAIGLFYYLRIISAVFSRLPAEGSASLAAPPLPWSGRMVLATLTLLIIWLGVNPTGFLQFIRTILPM